MVGLLLLHFSNHLEVILRLSEALTLDLLDVAIGRLERILSSLDLRHLRIDVLLESLALHISRLILLLKSLGLGSNFLESSGVIIVILLKLLELSPLLEQSLRGSSALVFKNLLLLKISTLRSLNELVSVVLVSHLQVVEGVGQSLDLLLTLSEFSIELITVSLELFLLLSCFDDKVSL